MEGTNLNKCMIRSILRLGCLPIGRVKRQIDCGERNKHGRTGCVEERHSTHRDRVKVVSVVAAMLIEITEEDLTRIDAVLREVCLSDMGGTKAM